MAKKPRNDKSTSSGNEANMQKDLGYDKAFQTIRRLNSQPLHDRQSQSNDSKVYSSFKVVLFYCSLIVFLPVITFFMLKSFLLHSLFVLTEVQGNIYAAVGAVVALHVALGLYIYRAYFNVDSITKRKKAN